MTQLLEKAYQRIAQLPESEQNTIASVILDELASEEQWNEKFAVSGDLLSRMAQQARLEHREG
ncbi:MAG: hypothetical protein NT023_22065 [Armatimonadetes bacterium]|nr:hypothetical protein [Armatimonadota bacterium]